MDPTTCVLNGGEDYELLFTVDIRDYDKVKDMEGITIVGHMTDAAQGVNLINRNGQQVPIVAQGWDALLKQENK